MARLADIGGVDAVARLQRQICAEARMFPDDGPPSAAQVAMVLHALADHASLQLALQFARPDDGHWPEATSVGRFLHAYGDRFDELAHSLPHRLTFYEAYALARVADEGFAAAHTIAVSALDRLLDLGMLAVAEDLMKITAAGRAALAGFVDRSVEPR